MQKAPRCEVRGAFLAITKYAVGGVMTPNESERGLIDH